MKETFFSNSWKPTPTRYVRHNMIYFAKCRVVNGPNSMPRFGTISRTDSTSIYLRNKSRVRNFPKKQS